MDKFHGLYENIGKKIKSLAIIVFIVESIGIIITGLALFCVDPETLWWGLLISIFGPFVIWAGTWFIYGFGELVDKTCDISSKMDVSTCSIEEKNDKNKTENFLESKENSDIKEKIVEEKPNQEKFNQEKLNQENVVSYGVSTFKMLNAYSISCDACKYAQSIKNKTCSCCGAKFI